MKYLVFAALAYFSLSSELHAQYQHPQYYQHPHHHFFVQTENINYDGEIRTKQYVRIRMSDGKRLTVPVVNGYLPVFRSEVVNGYLVYHYWYDRKVPYRGGIPEYNYLDDRVSGNLEKKPAPGPVRPEAGSTLPVPVPPELKPAPRRDPELKELQRGIRSLHNRELKDSEKVRKLPFGSGTELKELKELPLPYSLEIPPVVDPSKAIPVEPAGVIRPDVNR